MEEVVFVRNLVLVLGLNWTFSCKKLAKGKTTVGQTPIPVQKMNDFRSPYLTIKYRTPVFLKQKVQTLEI